LALEVDIRGMFVHYRTQGFILKITDRGEADQLLTVYTKDFGKLEILAKAVRKISSKLRPGTEIFNLSDIEFIQGKTHKTLTDAILIDKFENIRKDLKKLRIAYKITDLLNNLVSSPEPDEKIWHLLLETFKNLNTEYKIRDAIYKIYYFFIWKLLAILGYTPELYNCVLCQKKLKPDKLFFSAREGGAICNFCKKSVKSTKEIKEINIETIKILRILLKGDWGTLARLKIKVKDLQFLKAVSDYFLSEITSSLEKSLKKS